MAWLEHLILANFRNYLELDLDLTRGPTLIHGGNAQGKTNLLEAVYFLATSRSPRATSDRELIHWEVRDQPLPYARVVGSVYTAGERHQIEIVLTTLPTQGGASSRLQKRIRMDGVPRRAVDLVGQVPVVLFSPQDIELVAGSPGGRRRFLDATLCQMDRTYCRHLREYQTVLTQRNHLLRAIQEGSSRREELAFWDDKLVELGSTLTQRRYRLLVTLGARTAAVHSDLTGGQEHLILSYWCSLDEDDRRRARREVRPESVDATDAVPELPALEAKFRARLTQRQAEEIARGMTVVGPHRDDVLFLERGVDLGVYGSRGQQRTATVSLKLAEAQVLAQETGEKPILLLDDVMSELDPARRSYLLAHVEDHDQTIITATSLHAYPREFLSRARVLRVEQGAIVPTNP